jgi:hypothetical protein
MAYFPISDENDEGGEQMREFLTAGQVDQERKII